MDINKKEYDLPISNIQGECGTFSGFIKIFDSRYGRDPLIENELMLLCLSFRHVLDPGNCNLVKHSVCL
jgi:hypothetical protein